MHTQMEASPRIASSEPDRAGSLGLNSSRTIGSASTLMPTPMGNTSRAVTWKAAFTTRPASLWRFWAMAAETLGMTEAVTAMIKDAGRL